MSALLLASVLLHLVSRLLPAERIGGPTVADGLGVVGAVGAVVAGAMTAPESWAAAAWAVASGVVMLANMRFSPRRVGHGIPTLFAALALLPMIAAVVTLQSAPIPELRPDVDPLLLAHAGLQAGGLALLAMALVLASEDEALRPTSGLAAALALATVVLAAALASGSPELGEGIFLPMRTAENLPLELHGARQLSSGAVEFVALTMRDAHDAGSQFGLLMILAPLTALAGVLSPSRIGSRIMWGVAGLIAVVAAFLVWSRVGGALVPDAATLTAYTEALKVPPEQIVRPLTANAPGPYQIHPADVLPVCIALGAVALIAAYRAARPTSEQHSSTPEREQLRPGALIGASRDAMMLGALLLWLGAGLGLFAAESHAGRFFTDHRLAGHLAVAVLASASVMAWHAAARRGSHRAFSVWVAMPAATLILAALVMISGRLTGVPFHVLTVFP